MTSSPRSSRSPPSISMRQSLSILVTPRRRSLRVSPERRAQAREDILRRFTGGLPGTDVLGPSREFGVPSGLRSRVRFLIQRVQQQVGKIGTLLHREAREL